MLKLLIYGMVYLGSALMVFNIYSYIRYARWIQQQGDWEHEVRILRLPIFLLVMFLLGYLGIGFFGKPDLLTAGILFGGSIFVAVMVFLIQRITNRILLNEKMAAKLLAAENSNRMKMDFLSNMSHEMRTPLNAILGQVRVSEETGDLSPETKKQMTRISASARHLLSIINDILDMSYIDAGMMEIRESRFSFSEMILQLNTMVSSDCQDKGLNYNCERIGEIDEEFIGDAMKLKQVLLSILDNAVKYTEAPGFVRSSVEQTALGPDSRRLRFTVEDSGIGIDPDYLSQVFDAFSREDFSNTGIRGGSGLGLPIAKNLAEMMGGGIDIQSEKGVGTIVTVTVVLGAVVKDVSPVPEPKTESEEEEKADDDTEIELAGRRILIVEDIDLNAEILTDLLEMEEMSSERAENGQIAVNMFSEGAAGYYDAILMDLRMPVMDGLEATRRIRALEHPDAGRIPIIALTANTFEEDVKNCMDAGMDAHLPKPADIDLLCSTLKHCLRNRGLKNHS
ncbi:MAG: response regulator [Oscillospiraceae bacterium]|nr:response regulator [Oscillospiraceae bacterium]